MFTILVAVAVTVPVSSQLGGLAEVVQAVEAGINDIIFIGIAVYFLVTVESRIKRRRALNSLHELRSVVHIVDMHQLTKDPEGLFVPHASEDASRQLTPPELGRYLDFCSEMLSLAAKLSALYVQHFNDPVVLAAVNEIETLSGGAIGENLAENHVAGTRTFIPASRVMLSVPHREYYGWNQEGNETFVRAREE